MATNFEHMKRWNTIYEKMLFVEKLLTENDSKECYMQALGSIRGAMDMMMKELMKAAGIKDAKIIKVKQQNGKQGDRVDLFGRILAAEKLGIITSDSANNLHRIRSLGNDAVHGSTVALNKNKKQLKAEAEELYEKFYRESYLFAMQYIPECEKGGVKQSKPAGVNAGKSRGQQAGEKKPSKSAVVVLGIILVVLWLAFMFGIGSSMGIL